MKNLLILLSVLMTTACGSFTTVTKTNYEISHNLKRHETKCTVIPRVYSGISYDFCRFNAEPNTFQNKVVTETYLLDMLFFSPIVDTVLLPVTVYQQVKYGSVDLKK